MTDQGRRSEEAEETESDGDETKEGANDDSSDDTA
jgi:hypothetical protein